MLGAERERNVMCEPADSKRFPLSVVFFFIFSFRCAVSRQRIIAISVRFVEFRLRLVQASSTITTSDGVIPFRGNLSRVGPQW